MARKLIVFADGTGNAFSHQESNVWRMYQALEKRPDQIARYIPGVGTSSIRIVAALDGAIGFGVPENVRKLYRFLCWNWRPGDEIYLFGFSRGAFTVRALAGMIASQGLMPAKIADPASGLMRDVTHDEMSRNTMAAWRAYREETASWKGFYPNLWISRPIRNATLLMSGAARTAAALVKQRAAAFAQWQAGHPQAVPGSPPCFVPMTGPNGEDWSGDAERLRRPSIRLLGVYDTVEAFGVPIDELRPVIDRFIWPIRFRNRLCSPIIEEVRHAIALDDERTTFHPVRFERDPGHNVRTRFLEVWFAGVHSDVGGGYPDDGLAHLPLVWMIEEVGALQGGGLAFSEGALGGFRAQATARGPLHDSRAGASVFYRYAPRTMESGPAFGGDPLLHPSVLEKMEGDTEKYAPVPLSKVMSPNSGAAKGAPGMTAQMPTVTLAPTGSDRAIRTAQRSNGSAPFVPSYRLRERALDYVWWRRVIYFAMLFTALLIASLPLTADVLSSVLNGIKDRALAVLTAACVVPVCSEPSAALSNASRSFIENILDVIRALVGQSFEAGASFMPGFLAPWTASIRYAPVVGFLLFLLLGSLYLRSQTLQGRIVDTGHQAWRQPLSGGFNSVSLDIARFFRRSALSGYAYLFLKRQALPMLFGAMLLVSILGIANRVTIHGQTVAGDVCQAEERYLARRGLLGIKWVPLQPGVVTTLDHPFRFDIMCWPSGVQLSKGRNYTIWLDSDLPPVDQTIMAPLAGFEAGLTDPVHGGIGSVILKRWPAAPWMRPIMQIGPSADDAQVLIPLDGAQPVQLTDAMRLPRNLGLFRYDLFAKTEAARHIFRYDENLAGSENLRTHEPWTALPPAVRDMASETLRKHGPVRFAARFTAKANGPLYLYLNDAMIGLPLSNRFMTRFYRNNHGQAVVTILEEANPARPDAVPAAAVGR